MEYTINELAKLAKISTRTLRYYDEYGLLKPDHIRENGYRVYCKAEVDKLQQILFYRELNLSLSDIKKILNSRDFEAAVALEEHLVALKERRRQLDVLINNVEKSIKNMKGEIVMSDKERFEGFKQKLIDENEKKYGAEVRAKYGDEAADSSNAKIKGMSEEKYARAEELRNDYEGMLKAAFEEGDPAGEKAQKACELHKEWLCVFYDKYSPEYHMGLAEMYVADPRFTEYYDKIAKGCAEFLRKAIVIYCKG